MGCNCGSSNNYKYVYTDGDGRQWTYDTEVEALAAKVRDHNRGSVRAVPK